MKTHREMLALFFDGELSQEEAAGFREHLADCADCQRELHELMQLEALGMDLAREEARAPAVPSAAVHQGPGQLVSLSERRRRFRRPLLGSAAAVIMAAAVLLLWYREPSPTNQVAQVTEVAALPGLGSTRSVAGRSSYPGADQYRPYDVQRAGAPVASAQIPASKLAELEKQGDIHGIAAAYLLMDNRTQAGMYLERAQQSAGNPDNLDNDRALLLLLEGKPAAALDILDRVLARSPQHPQALWNRGLALQALGKPLEAAQAFEAVAAQGEPGWHEEARERAKHLRAAAGE